MGRSKKRQVAGGNGGSSPTTTPTRKSTKRPRQGNNSGAEDNDQATTPAAGGSPGRGQVQVGGGNSANTPITSGGATVKLNPLMIDLILSNLVQFLDPPSLGVARSVCKAWKDFSFPAWRSYGAILTLKYWMTNSRWDPRLGIWTTELEKFLEFWEEQSRDSPHPYRQFRLEDWQFVNDEVWNVVLRRFWQLVGGSLRKLTLVNCRATQSKDFFKVIIQSCPNLETLILENCVFSNRIRIRIRRRRMVAAGGLLEHPNLMSLSVIKTGNMGQRHPRLRIPLLELLSHFPRLTSFQGVPNNRKPYDYDLKMLRAVTRIREQDGRKLPLKQLNVDNPVDVGGSGEVVDGLNQVERREIKGLADTLDIPLTSIRLARNMGDANEIKKIVEFHGPALVKLIAVMMAPVRPRCDFPFGVPLHNLKELNISDGFCNSLKFLKFTPNLETLRIVDAGTFAEPNGERKHGEVTTLISSTSVQDLEDVKLLKLTTLQVEYIVQDEDVRRLVKWIPNVTNVEMFLDDNQFPIVCQAWKKLVLLRVYGEALTDRGVTGITELEPTTFGNGNVPLPNITHLRDLQVFDAPNSKLTDLSVTHGLMEISFALRHVSIRNTQITDAAKKTLHEKYIKIDFGFVEQDNAISNNNDQ